MKTKIVCKPRASYKALATRLFAKQCELYELIEKLREQNQELMRRLGIYEKGGANGAETSDP
jgi:hypothetical protein